MGNLIPKNVAAPENVAETDPTGNVATSPENVAAVDPTGNVIGVNHPAIVREIPHFDVFPAFPHFSENVPHFWLYFEKQIFLINVIILGARKKLST